MNVQHCKFPRARSAPNSSFLPITAVFIFENAVFCLGQPIVGSLPHIITMVHVPVSTCDIKEYCCPALSNFWKSFALWKSPSLRLFALLVRATCDEQEWSFGRMILAEENRSTGRETPLSVTLSSMNPLWTGLQLYPGIRSYRSVTNCLTDVTALRRERIWRKIGI